jgi:Cyclin
MSELTLNLLETPLYQILKIVCLQDYAIKLVELGYGYDIQSLAGMSKDQLLNLYQRIQVPPELIIKFQDVIELMKFLKPIKNFKRSNSNQRPDSDSASITRRKSFTGSQLGQEKKFENLTSLFMDYNSKLENDRKEGEEQAKLKSQLEEAKRKIDELTKELYMQKEANKAFEVKNNPEKNTEKIGTEPLPKIEILRKEVGVSYDSSKLRSTLAHLDIEEMCRCLAKSIKKHISHSIKVNKSRESLTGSISSIPTLFSSNCEDKIDKGVKVPGMLLEMFKQEFDDPQAFVGRAPSETDIYNFCKNIIFRSKMEKECSIICLIYIERMIQKSGLYINEKNWKKLTLISLIIASKVWDDESYENIHFAKVFTKYPLREINSLERLFLNIIEYDVGIKKSEYARYYFVLRTFTEKNNRSFPLKPLDVDTVRRLQSNSHKAEQLLKDLHSDSVFKTA